MSDAMSDAARLKHEQNIIETNNGTREFRVWVKIN
jgi:hypothetical protein